ncbi:MAG TPA: adenylate/guanylate cyclase domain-containing protein [Saprospiraceae bacterium]|nr:adenylate/guanylate cyclase domain-containing protein [Saprospiraceae bacterium]
MKCPLVVVFVFLLNTGYSFPDSLDISNFNDRFHHYFTKVKSIKVKEKDTAFIQLKQEALKIAPVELAERIETEFKAFYIYQASKNPNISNDSVQKQLIDFKNKCRQKEYFELVAFASYLQGQLYWRKLERADQAIVYYNEAYEIVRRLNPEEFYWKQRIIYNLGEKFYYLTDYQDAIRYLSEAAATVDPKNPLRPFISIYNTMGLCHSTQNQMSEAKECFLKALEYAENSGAKVWTGILRGNMGNIALREGNIERAKQLLHKDKEICLEVGARNPAAGALLGLAEISISERNMTLGEAQLDSALKVIRHRLNYRHKKAYYPLMSKIKAFDGDAFSSALYLDSALMVSDSLTRLDNSLQLLRLNQRIDYQEAKAEITAARIQDQKRRYQLLATLVGLLLTSLGGFLVYRQKRKTDRARKRSDELLLNILPAEVANELKSTGITKPKRYDPVTVLFSDFKDFTKTAAECSPEELVNQLHEIFSAFDDIVEKYGLEKIKTIGDAYLCVGGLPNQDDAHAVKIVECALEIMKYMASHPSRWELRIGVHTGATVAGIVGKKKFAYDIWGDAVNTAARMEQQSVPGAINISKATYAYVCDDFICDYRGKIAAKGKGTLDMYFVRSKR